MQAVYTVDQVAGYFGKSARTIRKWIETGKLPAKKVGKGYVVTEDALNELVQPPTPATAKRSTIAQEFISFMQSLDLPRGSMERTMRKDLAAEGMHKKG